MIKLTLILLKGRGYMDGNQLFDESEKNWLIASPSFFALAFHNGFEDRNRW